MKYTKFYLFVFSFILGSALLNGQSGWRQISKEEIGKRNDSRFDEMPAEYFGFSMNASQFRDALLKVPAFQENKTTQGTFTMELPSLHGSLAQYDVYEQPVMEAGLQQKYPMLKAYKAHLHENPSVTMWFTMSPYGFSAVIHGENKVWYIDQWFENDMLTYLAYPVDSYKNDPYHGIPACGVDHGAGKPVSFMPVSRSAAEVEMRVYRLAMACTGEWGRIRGTVAKCLSDMNIMVTRLTQIYESEVAIRYVLINDNDKLIFIDPVTDPYTGSDMAKTILPTNSAIINDRVGANNYDIGHVLSICFDVGGVAQLGSACQSNKGNGVTCFNDMNFEYAVASIMAHEVGHQFDATHTFNSCAPSQENATASSAYEPGSGTTIMSYGGLCGVDNVTSGSDAYFHVASLEQILFKTLTGGDAYGCAQKIASGNHNPVVTMPTGGFTIPKSTPFELTASATDEDGDAVTYRWEQYNLGPQSTLGNPAGNAPLFRSLPSNPSPTRFFPMASRIFKNTFNAKDEVLPTIERPMKFKCVVRDDKPAGVGVTWDEVSFNVSGDAGPFFITFPRLDSKFKVGDGITVTWDVANTDVAPVNCKKVNIYLSLNEALITGDTNLILLAKEVTNNGSAKVVIPNKITNKANFVIKAADNIFLTTSVLPSIIQMPVAPAVYVGVDNDLRELCLPASPAFEFTTQGLSGLTDSIRFEVAQGLPAGALATFSQSTVAPGEGTTLTINMDDVVGKGLAEIVVRGFVPGVDTVTRYLRVYYTATRLNDLATLAPENGLTGGSVLPVFTWTANSDATQYQIQLATNPSFTSNVLVFDRTLSNTTFTSSVILEKSTVYYWRVRAINPCKEGDWSGLKAFSTEVLSCKEFKSGELAINISASGKPTVETSLNVDIDGTVSDVNVTKIRCDHQRNGDIIAAVLAPSGKEIIMWSKKCPSQKNMNLGLDDESPIFFGCPLNNERIMKPDNKLAGFQGEATKGNWTLRLYDDVAGEGGRLLEFNLEICSNVSVAAPYLVINETLQIPPGDKPTISLTHLLVADQDNTADQLVYTLVTLPTHGSLTLSGLPLTVGSVFTQTDVNNLALKYIHDGSADGSDNFNFTVVDNQGGWIPVTTFSIEIDESFPSGLEDVTKKHDISVFPNPADGGDVIVSIPYSTELFNQYMVFDMSGKKCLQGSMIQNQASIPVSNLKSGMYAVFVYNDRHSVSASFIKN